MRSARVRGQSPFRDIEPSHEVPRQIEKPIPRQPQPETPQARAEALLSRTEAKREARRQAIETRSILETLGSHIPYIDYGYPDEWADLSREERWVSLPNDIKTLLTPENIEQAKQNAWVLTGQLYPPELMVNLTPEIKPVPVPAELAIRWLLMTPEQQLAAKQDVAARRNAYYPKVHQLTSKEASELKAQARELAQKEVEGLGGSEAGYKVTQDLINKYFAQLTSTPRTNAWAEFADSQGLSFLEALQKYMVLPDGNFVEKSEFESWTPKQQKEAFYGEQTVGALTGKGLAGLPELYTPIPLLTVVDSVETTEPAGGGYVKNEQLEGMDPALKDILVTQGWDAYRSKIKDAEAALSRYYTEGEGYNLTDIMVAAETWNPDLYTYASILFGKEQAQDSAMQVRAFMQNNVILPDGTWIPKETLNSLPSELKEIAVSWGWVALENDLKANYILLDGGYVPKDSYDKFVASNVELADGQWVSKEDWEDIPPIFQAIGTEFGYSDMIKAIERVQKQFEETHIKLADDQWILKKDFDNLSPELQAIALKSGFSALSAELGQLKKDFDASHVQLGDGQWMTLKDWDNLVTYDAANGTKYADIAFNNGFKAMSEAIDEDNKAREVAIETMKPYETGEGYDLLTARRKGVTPETMLLAGFDEKTVKWADDTYNTSVETGVALPGQETWVLIDDPNGKRYENDEKAQLIADYEAQKKLLRAQDIQGIKEQFPDLYAKLQKEASTQGLDIKLVATPSILGDNPEDMFALSPESGRRLLIELPSMLFFSPLRMALPEVSAKDIKPLDYAIGAAQLATWSLPVLPKGVMPFVSAGASSIIGYSVATNWNQLDTFSKVLGTVGTVVIALPALAAIGKAAVPIAVRVPTAEGEVVVWKGYSVNGKPIFGISQGKLVIGGKGVPLPEIAEIKAGWHPVTKIETTLLGTTNALKKMGASVEDIARVQSTWEEAVPAFARKPSPAGVTPTEILAGSQRLEPDEIATILQQVVKNSDKVTEVYGSSTIRPQLESTLRNWRQWHDIDIQTSMTADEVKRFTNNIATALENSGTEVRVSPQNIGTIEKLTSEGTWEKITDIHSKEYIPGSEPVPEGAYGYMFAEKPIKITLPGVGELQIMTLSETGIRKAASITSFQAAEGIAPAAYRTNDIADFYVILLNYKGTAVAAEWAKAFGLAPEELLGIATKNPPKMAIWSLSPSVVATKGEVPSVAISVPASLADSILTSLKNKIQKPSPVASPEAVSYILRAIPSAPITVEYASLPKSVVSESLSSITAMSMPLSYSLAMSPAALKRTGRSISMAKVSTGKASPSAGSKTLPSLSSLPLLSTPSSTLASYTLPSPKISPSSPPSSPSVSPAPPVSPSISVSPGPSSPYSESPPVFPKPGVKPGPLLVLTGRGKEQRQVIPSGAITWRQGKFWKYIPPPWTLEKPISLRHPPLGAKTDGKTPKQTVQMVGKPRAIVPKSVSVDLGVVDITIENYGRDIKFKGGGTKTVVGQSLPSPTVGMSVTEGALEAPVDKALRKLPLGTTVDQLLREVYPENVPKKFADKLLAEKLGKMSSEEIAQAIADSGVDSRRKAQVYKMLPDRVSKQVKKQLETGSVASSSIFAGLRPLGLKNSKRLRRKKTGSSKIRPVFREPVTHLIVS